MYLLDTNACLDFLLGREPKIRPRIEAAIGQLAISSISLAELHVGNRWSEDAKRDAHRLDRFLAGVDLVVFDEAAAKSYGTMMQRLDVRRTNFDRLIAAHALALRASLITRNLRHFADVPGLVLEDWTQ